MRPIKITIWIGVLSASLTLPVGCRKPEVIVYDTPKDTSNNDRAFAQNAPASATTKDSPLAWTPDTAWQQLPPTQFRKGNYLFSDTYGSAEITVTSFPGSTGGMLANVNRWLRQADLPETSDTQLSELIESVELSGSIVASLVDLKDEHATDSSTRIYAAIVPFQGQSWFFKLSGPHATVESQIPAFKTMIDGLRFGQAAAPAATAHDSSDHEGDLVFTAPEGWIASQGSSMRIASFAIAQAGSPNGDFSITSFPGDTGGVEANVNRWRRQIGLEPWTVEQVTAASEKFENEAGLDFIIFDLKAVTDVEKTKTKERILAAILERSGKSWFFKLKGEAFLVDTQNKKFKALLQSVDFDHSGHAH